MNIVAFLNIAEFSLREIDSITWILKNQYLLNSDTELQPFNQKWCDTVL